MAPASLALCSGAEPSGFKGSATGKPGRIGISVNWSGHGCCGAACASIFSGLRTPKDNPAKVDPDSKIASRREMAMVTPPWDTQVITNCFRDLASLTILLRALELQFAFVFFKKRLKTIRGGE